MARILAVGRSSVAPAAFVAGLAAASVGVGMVYLPAGLIFGGLTAAFFAAVYRVGELRERALQSVTPDA